MYSSSMNLQTMLMNVIREHTHMIGTWTDPDGNPVVWGNLPDDRTGFSNIIILTGRMKFMITHLRWTMHSCLWRLDKCLPYRLSAGLFGSGWDSQDRQLETNDHWLLHYPRYHAGRSLENRFQRSRHAFIKQPFANQGANKRCTSVGSD